MRSAWNGIWDWRIWFAVFRAGFWRRVGSAAGWNLGAGCAWLSPGRRCGDAGFAVVLPDVAVGGDGCRVHIAAFDGDHVATRRDLLAGDVLQVGGVAAGNSLNARLWLRSGGCAFGGFFAEEAGEVLLFERADAVAELGGFFEFEFFGGFAHLGFELLQEFR